MVRVWTHGGMLVALTVLAWATGCARLVCDASTSPYLVYLERSQFAVVLADEPSSTPLVEWWPGGSSAQSARASRQAGLWVARLPSLPAGTRLTYRVWASRGPGGLYAFRAGAPRGAAFRFAVYGGTTTDPEVHEQIVKAIAREHIDFAVHTGRFVEAGRGTDAWRCFLQLERPVIAKAPLLPAVGAGTPADCRELRRRFFLHQPAYVRDWGDLRLVFIDATASFQEGSIQYRFVRDQLSDAAKQRMYAAIVVHAPPFSSGRSGSDLAIRAVVARLAARYGVELVLSGQAPHYERSRSLEGTTYIVSGAAGARIYPVDPQPFSAKSRPEPHYVLVDVMPHGLALQVINLDSVTVDAHLVRPNPPRASR